MAVPCHRKRRNEPSKDLADLTAMAPLGHLRPGPIRKEGFRSLAASREEAESIVRATCPYSEDYYRGYRIIELF